MNGRPDAGSCAALATQLRQGAQRLKACTADDAAVVELASVMEHLGHALDDFAAAERDPRPRRPGRALPQTSLRRISAEAVMRLVTAPPGR